MLLVLTAVSIMWARSMQHLHMLHSSSSV